MAFKMLFYRLEILNCFKGDIIKQSNFPGQLFILALIYINHRLKWPDFPKQKPSKFMLRDLK